MIGDASDRRQVELGVELVGDSQDLQAPATQARDLVALQPRSVMHGVRRLRSGARDRVTRGDASWKEMVG